jgi:APA family basic amino acid/polyamine antiporter
MFVAYTGYGRIATLGEEVENPRRNIPRAIVLTLWVSMSLYIGVAFVGLAAVGAEALSSKDSHIAAPLAQVAQSFSHPSAFVILSIGACTSMLGVLLNLILGLSRVILAMARRGDMPRRLAEVNSGGSPTFSILAVGSIILGLVAIGSIEIAWTFSAFTVLCYYAITNAAALQLPKDKRLYHPAISIFGLSACLGLAFWVERTIWIVGLLMLFSGLLLRHMFRDTPKE